MGRHGQEGEQVPLEVLSISVVVLSRVSVDEVFMHYFQNMSSVVSYSCFHWYKKLNKRSRNARELESKTKWHVFMAHSVGYI